MTQGGTSKIILFVVIPEEKALCLKSPKNHLKIEIRKVIERTTPSILEFHGLFNFREGMFNFGGGSGNSTKRTTPHLLPCSPLP